MHRRHLLIGAVAALIVSPRRAAVAAERPFDPNAFRAAQEAGRSIVVQIHATW